MFGKYSRLVSWGSGVSMCWPQISCGPLGPCTSQFHGRRGRDKFCCKTELYVDPQRLRKSCVSKYHLDPLGTSVRGETIEEKERGAHVGCNIMPRTLWALFLLFNPSLWKSLLLLMRTLSFRPVKWLAQYHLVTPGQSGDVNWGGVGMGTQAVRFQNLRSGPLDGTFSHDKRKPVNRKTNICRHGAVQWRNLGAVRGFVGMSI